jgi:hypothetical protein
VRTLALQRCACGGHSQDGGECPACRARRLGNAAPLVHETLNRPGRPLERGVREELGHALGFDFSGVRVHTDDTAAASAAAVSARAYTVGSSVVFGADGYRPESSEGRRLLAHELTHVRQQAGAAAGGPLQIVDDPAAEAEAHRAAAAPVRPVQRALQRLEDEPEPEPDAEPPAEEHEPEAGAPPELEDEPEEAEEAEVAEEGAPSEALPMQQAPPAAACRVLGWADFTVGRPPGGFGALTRFSIPHRRGSFQAVFSPRSVVLAKFPGAGARRTNGCAPLVRRCERAFRNVPRGTTRTFDVAADPTCPASIITPGQATTRGECETVIGAQCDADAPNESARLLNHEQRHLDIACKIADKANAALAAGTALATVRRAVTREQRAVTRRYDSRAETDHGCDAAGQATWDADIDAGLPGVTIP